ncbi:MAG: YbaB/EbfC family nucleoid-associated protein [Bacilli bacterium]|nr:YbaB/EbfC family nucleoid-associated protein [Bacilli bacterium]
MNQQAMLKKIKQMQKEMMDTQQEIENTVFEASVTGIVTVEVMGNKYLKKVIVEEGFELESPEDYEMLSDSIVAACAKAYKDIEEVTEERMAKFQMLLNGIPGLF